MQPDNSARYDHLYAAMGVWFVRRIGAKRESCWCALFNRHGSNRGASCESPTLPSAVPFLLLAPLLVMYKSAALAHAR